MRFYQVTTSIASYVGHDPAHAMDSVHQVATLLGGWIGAVTLTGLSLSLIKPLAARSKVI